MIETASSLINAGWIIARHVAFSYKHVPFSVKEDFIRLFRLISDHGRSG